jgi:hypothetical protein
MPSTVHPVPRIFLRAALAGGLFASLVACDSKDSAEQPTSTEPLVGPLELAVSHRSGGGEPSGFIKLEISPTELRVDGKPLLTLQGGRPPAGERAGSALPKVKAALAAANRGMVAFEVHAQVSYETLALAVGSAVEAGMHKMAFKVRKPGGSTDLGWLVPERVQVTAPTEDEVPFANLTPRPWGDFVEAWAAVEAGCRGAATGSCGYRPENIAEGGHVKIVLHAQGDGLNLRFQRVGAPPPVAAAKPARVEMEDGVPGRVDPVAEVENAPPATQAEFQFRSKEATGTSSPLAEAMKPICGGRACGVVVSADRAAMTVRILSLIGAAFPDGTPAPTLAFEIPPG